MLVFKPQRFGWSVSVSNCQSTEYILGKIMMCREYEISLYIYVYICLCLSPLQESEYKEVINDYISTSS